MRFKRTIVNMINKYLNEECIDPEELKKKIQDALNTMDPNNSQTTNTGIMK